MFKILTLLLSSLLFVGCAAAPPGPVQPKGKESPVNPVSITIEDLR